LIVAGVGSSDDDMHFLQESTEEGICDRIVKTIGMFADAGWDPVRDVQVLSPLRERTAIGCSGLNMLLQGVLNSGNPKLQYLDRKGQQTGEEVPFRVGDKVIQTRNDYDNNVMNGEIGYVESIWLQGAKKNKMEVAFVDVAKTRELQRPVYNRVVYHLKMSNLQLAYAVTVHKYQGSESPVVVMPVHRCFGNRITQRNLLYTAVSRASKMCVLVGEAGEVGKMIGRVQSMGRNTGLVEKVCGAYERQGVAE
jgi:exodeoxyribonuclease V alpha subunit